MPFSKNYREQLIERENQRLEERLNRVRPHYDFSTFEYQYETRKMHVSPPIMRKPPQMLRSAIERNYEATSGPHSQLAPIGHREALAETSDFSEFYGQVDTTVRASPSPRETTGLMEDIKKSDIEPNFSNSSVNNQISSRFANLEPAVTTMSTFISVPNEENTDLPQKESVFGFQNNNPTQAEEKRPRIQAQKSSEDENSQSAHSGTDLCENKASDPQTNVDVANYKDSMNFASPGEEAHHETDQLRTTDFEGQPSTKSALGANNLKNVDLGIAEDEDFD